MAFEIIWTKQAKEGYDKIIDYLAFKWSDREIKNFILGTNSFLKLLSDHPEILQKSSKQDLYRGPINKYTILTYQVKTKEQQIVLINIRSARQRSF